MLSLFIIIFNNNKGKNLLFLFKRNFLLLAADTVRLTATDSNNMYIRSEYEETSGNEGQETEEVGCLLIFDETYKSVVDAFPLSEGRNYVCGSTRSVFEPQPAEKARKRAKGSKPKGVVQKMDNEEYHAVIHVEHGEFFVEDNGSKVGTFRKSLGHKLRPNCKYEIVPGDDLYFGNLKTRLIKYDSMDSVETPKWRRSLPENKEADAISLLLEPAGGTPEAIAPLARTCEKSTGNETASTQNEDTENDSFLSNNKPPRRKPFKNLQEKAIDQVFQQTGTASPKKVPIVLLWTGCTPTSRDVELIKRANITSVDSEDLEFMSDRVTHVVSSSIKRTLKFLWAVSRGLPIISPITLRQILNSSRNKDLDHKEFNELCMGQLLHDSEGEKKFGFTLENSIRRSQSNLPIFTGYKFVISPSIKVPSFGEISWLLKSCNAEIIEPESANQVRDKSKVIFVGTSSDKCKLFR